jgi:hypothetical protein
VPNQGYVAHISREFRPLFDLRFATCLGKVTRVAAGSGAVMLMEEEERRRKRGGGREEEEERRRKRGGGREEEEERRRKRGGQVYAHQIFCQKLAKHRIDNAGQ